MVSGDATEDHLLRSIWRLSAYRPSGHAKNISHKYGGTFFATQRGTVFQEPNLRSCSIISPIDAATLAHLLCPAASLFAVHADA